MVGVLALPLDQTTSRDAPSVLPPSALIHILVPLPSFGTPCSAAHHTVTPRVASPLPLALTSSWKPIGPLLGVSSCLPCPPSSSACCLRALLAISPQTSALMSALLFLSRPLPILCHPVFGGSPYCNTEGGQPPPTSSDPLSVRNSRRAPGLRAILLALSVHIPCIFPCETSC